MVNNKECITIVAVNFNSSDFIKLMLYGLQKLTYNPFKVLLCDNGSNRQELAKLKHIVAKYNNIEVIYRTQSKAGSIGHAEVLDILCSKVDTPYFVVMDADAVYLLKNWDTCLIDRIGEKVKCIGTAVSRAIKNEKPTDFPQVYSVLFETATFKVLGGSFMPDVVAPSELTDTGYKVRNAYLKAGYKGLVFETKSTREFKDTCFGNIICVAYYLAGELVSSHFGRGSGKVWQKYTNWYTNILGKYARYLLMPISMYEKHRWIALCKKIIDQQSSDKTFVDNGEPL
jgi:glycosyltransferase involved in cell wall biosynthesis